MNIRSFFLFAVVLSFYSCKKEEPEKIPQKAIAFFIENNNTTTLWYVETDGGSFEPVFGDTIGTSMNNPGWSADGRTIYFIKKSDKPDQNGIYSIKPNGKDFKAIYKDNDTQVRNFYQLTASTDDEHVIFSLEIPRNGRKVIEMYTMCPCGQSVKRLTNFEVPEPGQTINTEAYGGSFSPGDSLLVFTQGDPTITGIKTVKIFTMNMKTKEQKLIKAISANNVAACTPSYSPDGKKLLLSIDGFIYTMGADGADLKKLGNQKGFRPMWDKNGREFYFSGNEIPGVQAGIYKADINLTYISKVIRNNFSGDVGGFSVNPIK